MDGVDVEEVAEGAGGLLADVDGGAGEPGADELGDEGLHDGEDGGVGGGAGGFGDDGEGEEVGGGGWGAEGEDEGFFGGELEDVGEF